MPPVEAQWTWLAAASLGLIVGVRHAFEPDHLMAIATLTAGERSARGALSVGASWGIGHATSLFILGSALTVLRTLMPDTIAVAFEGLVAVMLLAIGLDAIRRGWRQNRAGTLIQHRHRHHDLVHDPATSGPHFHFGLFAVARRPLFVGMAHGIAGSGALTALALSALPTVIVRVIFILLFCLGSTAGMATLAGLAGWPLAKLMQRPRATAALRVATGGAAIIVGAMYARPSILALFFSH
jgi:ABC-type nickel/cobalt efflux system permease component RcnA